MTEVRSDAAGTIDTTAPAESIGGYALRNVHSGNWSLVTERGPKVVQHD